MINFESEVKKIMEESTNEITESLKKQLKQNIVDGLYYSCKDTVSKHVHDFLNSEDMKSEIAKVLEESKPVILESIQSSMIQIGAALAKSMVESAQNNLANSWSAKKITDELFK